MKEIKAIPSLEQSYKNWCLEAQSDPTGTELTVMRPAAFLGEVLLGWCDKDNIHIKITLNSCLVLLTTEDGKGQLLDFGQENSFGPARKGVCVEE